MAHALHALHSFTQGLRLAVFSDDPPTDGEILEASLASSRVNNAATKITAARSLVTRVSPRLARLRRELSKSTPIASLPIRPLVNISNNLGNGPDWISDLQSFFSYRASCSALYLATRGGAPIWPQIYCAPMPYGEVDAYTDIDSHRLHLFLTITEANAGDQFKIAHRNSRLLEELQLHFIPELVSYPTTLMHDGSRFYWHVSAENVQVFPGNDFVVINGSSQREASRRLGPAPHLHKLVLDIDSSWRQNIGPRGTSSNHLYPRDGVGHWDWHIDSGLFSQGSNLDTCYLRGVAFPSPMLSFLAFGRLQRFGYDGPAWLTADMLDKFLLATPHLKSLAINCFTFTGGPPKDIHYSVVMQLGQRLQHVFACVSRGEDTPAMLTHLLQRGVSDVVVIDDNHSCATLRLPSGVDGLSCGPIGTAYHYPLPRLSGQPSRVRLILSSIGFPFAFAQMSNGLENQVDASRLTYLSLHEFAFLQLLAPPNATLYTGTTNQITERRDIRSRNAFESVTNLTIWLASCVTHRTLGAAGLWHDSFIGIFVAVTASTEPALIPNADVAEYPDPGHRAQQLFPQLKDLTISAGYEVRSKLVPGRKAVEFCSSESLHGRLRRERCSCSSGGPPVVSLRSVEDVLLHCGWRTLHKLNICGLEVVDRDVDVALAELRNLVTELNLQEHAMPCDVAPVLAGDRLDAKGIFESLEGW